MYRGMFQQEKNKWSCEQVSIHKQKHLNIVSRPLSLYGFMSKQQKNFSLQNSSKVALGSVILRAEFVWILKHCLFNAGFFFVIKNHIICCFRMHDTEVDRMYKKQKPFLLKHTNVVSIKAILI